MPPLVTTIVEDCVFNGLATPAALVVWWIRSEAKMIPLPTVGRDNRYPYCRVGTATDP